MIVWFPPTIKESSSTCALKGTFQVKAIKIQPKFLIRSKKSLCNAKYDLMYNRVGSDSYLVAKLPTSTKGAIPSNIRTCEFWKSSAELQKLYAEYISYISAISYFWVSFFTCYKSICSFQNTSFYRHTPITHQNDYLQRTSSISIPIHQDPQKNPPQKCPATTRLAIRIHFIQIINKIPLIPTATHSEVR